MRLTDYVDCLIPRGGHSLIQSIREHATVPVIIDGDGNCHVYVDAAADLDEAARRSSSTRRRSARACATRAESLVVHEAVAADFVPRVAAALDAHGGRARRRHELAGVERRTSRRPPRTTTRTEFLDLKMSVAVVPDLDAAIDHVNRYGTGHTEAILTRDLHAARRFTSEVDAAAVIVNASTRFTDGEEFGFGAEIGISTQKLHARGPMGLRELTTYKYVIWGDGQIRA